MNEQNRKQVILLSVFGVVLLAVLVWQFVLPKGEDPIAGAPAAQAGAPAGGGAAPAAPRSRSAQAAAAPARLVRADVNVDDLLQAIKIVSFDYAEERIDRNPMAPLVGRLNTADTSALSGPTTPTMRDVIAKSVTGIVWDEAAPSAVVDNEIVSVGHTYTNGVKVYAIEPHRVIFLVGDSLVPVEMKEL